MISTIDMKMMRYINLFERVSRVSTRHCFVYNNTIIFVVPKPLMSKAVGKDGKNMKKIGEILRKKIKVVPMVTGEEGLGDFVKSVVEPVTFNKAELKDNSVVISAGRQSKAALIGRGRLREKELGEILKNFFKIRGLRIV